MNLTAHKELRTYNEYIAERKRLAQVEEPGHTLVFKGVLIGCALGLVLWAGIIYAVVRLFW